MNNDNGFTLVELLITVSILAILATVGVPSFQAIIQNSRATALTNDLVSALNLARSEATKRGIAVSVCATNNNWLNGWRVEPGNNCNANINDVIRVWPQTPPNSVILTNIANLGFDATGARLDAGAAETSFQVHSQNCSGERSRILRVSTTGRVGVERTSCPTQGGDPA